MNEEEFNNTADHRDLGKQLGIFTFDEDVGQGLPLWLPNGAIIIEELEKLAKSTELEAGYKRVRTPHIAKESMYETSGHLSHYKDSMFPPMDMDGEKYYLKAMNCPHHHKIFSALKPSLKELPLRLAEYGTCYRYEKSGSLLGLMRVRSLQMNDAHIYCTEEQFANEFRAVNDMYLKYFNIFGIEKYVMRFSTHAPEKLGEKYVNNPELWKKTEDMVRRVLIDSKIPYVEVSDEAAFYGPKIDIQVWSAIGKEFTLATNQVDFAVPEKFGLSFINKDGNPETPICIHRAPLGTHERFIGFLLEHYEGNLPTWMSPEQVVVLPIRTIHNEYANSVLKLLLKSGIRASSDERDENISIKVRNAETKKIPYILVVGGREEKNDSVSVRRHGIGNTGSVKTNEFINIVVNEIENRLK
jgi:threonyl-tRNA synthetase